MKPTNKLPYIAGILAALLISCGAGYFFVSQGEDYSAVNTERREPAKIVEPATPPVSTEKMTAAPEKISPVERQTGALNALDLSLGNFTIDDPEEKVRRALGTPISSSNDSDGALRLKYDALEVVLRNGKISALVSQSSSVSTPRGIHDGSPAQEVFNAYGTNYESAHFENDTLYEYTIISKDGTPCWLRFAVRDEDSRVDYISIRFFQ